MEERIYQIAIDGPSGAGKSTIAKALASILKIDYIDTGAMYRAIGYKIVKEGVDMYDEAALNAMLSTTDVDLSEGKVLLDGEDVSGKIRTPEMSKMASDCSALGAVRTKLVELQRGMAKAKSVIMDGRDIGTNVLTDAKYKIYLTATVEERAGRRYKELIEKGETVTFEEVLEDMKKRDHNDSTRALNPLRKADDAIEIDSTEMKFQEVVDKILEIVNA
ncbi:MAG: (d)CMP kinase [Firmicutes bacterium]|nr:(d)CMP kinase [Bacillota bacterium]MBR7148420.1 (d)CMP kinase [Bacillota bacterium]